MKLEVYTGQELVISNMKAKIVSIDPEIPSLYTTIMIEYTEGPYKGVQKILRFTNPQ